MSSKPFDLFVIGAGSGGVRAARMAAQRALILISVNLNYSPPTGFITQLINLVRFRRKNFAATCRVQIH